MSKNDSEAWQGAEVLARVCAALLLEGVDPHAVDRAVNKSTGSFFESYADLTDSLDGIRYVEGMIEREAAHV